MELAHAYCRGRRSDLVGVMGDAVARHSDEAPLFACFEWTMEVLHAYYRGRRTDLVGVPGDAVAQHFDEAVLLSDSNRQWKRYMHTAEGGAVIWWECWEML